MVNILVYWSSVEVYPRYLLMFCPLVVWHLGVPTPAIFLHNANWTSKVGQWLYGAILCGLDRWQHCAFAVCRKPKAPLSCILNRDVLLLAGFGA